MSTSLESHDCKDHASHERQCSSAPPIFGHQRCCSTPKNYSILLGREPGMTPVVSRKWWEFEGGLIFGRTDPHPTGRYAGIWVTRPDQAARFAASLAATPSVNLTASMTIGNRFAPFRRRQVLAAV